MNDVRLIGTAITPELRAAQDRLLSRPDVPGPSAADLAAEVQEGRRRLLAELLARVGQRYFAATLENYQAACPKQREVVAALTAYADQFQAERAAGNGIVLFGSSGTGKDHLLLGAARLAIVKHGARIVWRNGVDLFAEWRDLIGGEGSEMSRVYHYARPDVLILSDMLPLGEEVTAFQRQVLLQIIDFRYRQCRPTWLSLNVQNGEEAIGRMGMALFDRICHGTLVRFCNWPSYRAAKARKL